MSDKVYLTNEGFLELEEELNHLKDVKRPEVIKALKDARALGDLSENADYDAAREEQAKVEGRIAELEKLLEKDGETIVLTREPGGTPIAEEIRKACQMAENDTDEDLESGEYTVTIAKNHDITVDADKGGNKTHLETYLKSVLGPNFQKERLKSKSFSTINVKFSNFSIPTCNITYTNTNGNVTPN